jgi:hypothetical protein
VREGPALLAGLAVCARCGRLLHVEYKQHHHYVCSALAKECGVAVCLYLAGDGIGPGDVPPGEQLSEVEPVVHLAFRV